MYYYGYGVLSPGWRDESKCKLLKALKKDLRFPNNSRMNGLWVDVFSNELLEVRIMGIEVMTHPEREKLIELADEIYDRVMGIRHC